MSCCSALNVFYICEATLFGVTGPATQLLDQSLAGKTRPRIEVGLQRICETNWPQVCPTYQRGSDVAILGHTGPWWAGWPAYVSTNTTFVVALCPSQGVLKAALKDGQGGTTGNSWGACRVLPFSISSHRYIDPYGRYGPVWPCMTHVHPCPSMSISQSPVSAAETLNFCLAIHANNANENHLESDPSWWAALDQWRHFQCPSRLIKPWWSWAMAELWQNYGSYAKWHQLLHKPWDDRSQDINALLPASPRMHVLNMF